MCCASVDCFVVFFSCFIRFSTGKRSWKKMHLPWKHLKWFVNRWPNGGFLHVFFSLGCLSVGVEYFLSTVCNCFTVILHYIWVFLAYECHPHQYLLAAVEPNCVKVSGKNMVQLIWPTFQFSKLCALPMFFCFALHCIALDMSVRMPGPYIFWHL